MSKIAAFPLLAVVFFIPLMANPASAQRVDVLEPVCNADPKPAVCNDNAANNDDTNNPIVGEEGVLNRAINILSLIVGVACVVVIMISGLRFIVSAGDSNAISSARRSLLYAVVGLLIVIVARVIVRFVLSKLE